jgi:ferredoxin-type protein NapF
MECAAGCPGAFISFGPDAGVKTDGEGRRHFVKRICAFIIGAGYIGGRNVRDIMRDNFFASAASPDGEIPARPPGAADDGHFSSRCIGCLACAAVCPTGIIRSVGSIQPCLVYGSGYCQFNCVECGRVCPTDAITRLNAETKRRTRVALSDLTLPRCVVITKSQACGACAEVCPTRALSMVRGGAPGLTEPSFDSDYCIGCGACIAVCPAEPNAFALKGVRVQSLTPGIRELEDDGGTTPMSAGDDFPF